MFPSAWTHCAHLRRQPSRPGINLERHGCATGQVPGPLTNLPPACMMIVVSDAPGPGARRMVRAVL